VRLVADPHLPCSLYFLDMSDDDYAADSPFDGLDDYYFWDDAASQDVADDLAEHTMPSPVYLEDPAYEMMGGYSDWEYYSDDYYDDDPNLLKKNPQAGSPPALLKFPKGKTDSYTTQKRGRKRKLAETEDIPTLSLGGPGLVEIVQKIGHNITGTTWKTEKTASEILYHQGEAKRVALLKDWRNVFRESQPKSDRRSKGTSNNNAALRDEWANNLSLADMGLMTATGKHMPTNDIGNDYEEDEDEEPDSEQRSHFQDGGSRIEDRAVPLSDQVEVLTDVPGDDDRDFSVPVPTIIKAQSRDQILPSRKRKKTLSEAGADVLDPGNKSDVESQSAERIFSTSKKRKTGSVSSASARSIRNSNATTSLSTLESQANGTQKRGRGRPKKQAIYHAEAQSTNPRNTNNATVKTAAALNKKRKATTEPSAENDDGAAERDQTSGAKVAAASSRPKRVASDRTGVLNDGENDPIAQLPKRTTRGASTRKKREA
jgi:hypothetical protein